MYSQMRKKKILYICDLNLENGGAQRITIETLPCLSKVFDIFLYMENKPSADTLKLLNNMEVHIIVDFKLSKDNLKNLLIREGIELNIIQYENPRWIVLGYEIWKEIGVNYTVLFHELPFINTPTKKVFANWYIQVFLKIFSSFFKNLNQVSKISDSNNKKNQYNKLQSKTSYLKRNYFIKKKIDDLKKTLIKVSETRRGLANSIKIIAMGSASKYYIDKYFGFKNLIEVKNSASSDIQIVEGLLNLDLKDLKYDICFMAARLESGKGILDVLEIVYRVKQLLGDNIKTVILGKFVDRVTEQQFNTKLKKLKLEPNVILLGFVSESVKVTTICSSKIFLYPSKKDIFSISLANALFCGIPSVTYDLPFVQQFNSIPMYKTRYRDIRGMTKNVVELLKMCKFEALKFQELRRTIHSTFNANFSWNKTCVEQTEAIDSILNVRT